MKGGGEGDIIDRVGMEPINRRLIFYPHHSRYPDSFPLYLRHNYIVFLSSAARLYLLSQPLTATFTFFSIFFNPTLFIYFNSET